MTNSKDIESKLDSMLMKNFRLSLDYLVFNILLLFATTYLFVNHPLFTIIPIFVSLAIAYYSREIAIRKKYPTHNFYPIWFFAYVVSFTLFVISMMLIPNNFKIWVGIVFIIHVPIAIYTTAVSEQMVKDD